MRHLPARGRRNRPALEELADEIAAVLRPQLQVKDGGVKEGGAGERARHRAGARDRIGALSIKMPQHGRT